MVTASFYDLTVLMETGGDDDEEEAPGKAAINTVLVDDSGNWVAQGFSATGTVTGWRVELLRTSQKEWETLAENHPETSFALGVLAPGDYQVRVAARNGELQGPWSDPASFSVA
jgi:hypothetical protein